MATSALLLWALIVAAGDWRWRRIPNGLLLAAWVPGIAIFLFRERGVLDQGIVASAAGLLVALLVLLPGFLLKALGGGDVKFAACCAWFLGPERSAMMLVLMALTLGVASLAILLRRRDASSRSRRIVAGWAIAAGFAGSLMAGSLGH